MHASMAAVFSVKSEAGLRKKSLAVGPRLVDLTSRDHPSSSRGLVERVHEA